MSEQIIKRDGPTAQPLGSAATPLDSAEYPTPMGTVGPRSDLPWMRAFLDALDGECAGQPDPETCAMNAANKAVGQPAEEDNAMAQQSPTVERAFVPLHTNDFGDYPLPFVIRKDYSPEKRAEMAKKGHALPDGSYPIADKEDLSNAIHAFGRAPESKRGQVAAHIKRRAKALGATSDVSGQWGGTADEQKSMAERADSKKVKQVKQGMGDQSGEHVPAHWPAEDYRQSQETVPAEEDDVFDESQTGQRDENIATADQPDPSGRNEGEAAGDDIQDNRNRATDPAANKLVPAAPGPASQKQVYDGRNQAKNPAPKDMNSPVQADNTDVGAFGVGDKAQRQEITEMEQGRKRSEKKPNKLAGAGPAVGPTGAMGMQSMMSDRAILRKMEADDDARLLASPAADKVIPRPSHVDSNDWMSRPLAMRTLRAQIIERSVGRTYDEAVERTVAEGWQAIPNPTRPEEKVFQRWLQTPDGMLLTRSILVRTEGLLDWHLRELTRGASLSLAAQVPMTERRFGDTRPFELAASRVKADLPQPEPIVTRSALSSGQVQTFGVREAARAQFGAPLVTRVKDISGEGGPSESVEAGASSAAQADWTDVFNELKDWWSGLTETQDNVIQWADAYAKWWVAGARGDSPMPSHFGADDMWVGQKHNIENWLAERKPSAIHPLTKRDDIGGEGNPSQAVEGAARGGGSGKPASRLGDDFLNHARIHFEYAKTAYPGSAKHSDAIVSAAKEVLSKWGTDDKLKMEDVQSAIDGKMDKDISHYTPQGHYVTYGMVRDALKVLPAHQQAIASFHDAGAGSIEQAVPKLERESDDPPRGGPGAAKGTDMQKPLRDQASGLAQVQGMGAKDTRFKGGVIRGEAEVDRQYAFPPDHGKALSKEDQGKLKRAKDRLSMDDSKTRIVGGMSAEEAKAIIKELTGKEA